MNVELSSAGTLLSFKGPAVFYTKGSGKYTILLLQYALYMIVLGIETSCDETAISLIESRDGTDITVLADKTLTQIELHKQYGGVFPAMAKREHSRNLIPLLKEVLAESNFGIPNIEYRISNEEIGNIKELLTREPEMLEQFLDFIPTIEKPRIDAIAVTEGPGLEPCLWTGINLAKALEKIWEIPVIPVNHMEGHIISALMHRGNEISNSPKYLISNKSTKSKTEISDEFHKSYKLQTISYPALALLISGGHTELVLIKELGEYEIIGQTRDDAVGEAFDKVARLLGLPYPGGPEISRLAEAARNKSLTDNLKLTTYNLPRPMINSGDFDFSFSGIKTAVLYLIKKLPKLTDEIKTGIALEFENAVTEVLLLKTRQALEQYGARCLLLGGGVIANTHIRRSFDALSRQTGVPLLVPEKEMTTDNAQMIAAVGLIRASRDRQSPKTLKATGNMRLDRSGK